LASRKMWPWPKSRICWGIARFLKTEKIVLVLVLVVVLE